jgi:hypothetical protein
MGIRMGVGIGSQRTPRNNLFPQGDFSSSTGAILASGWSIGSNRLTGSTVAAFGSAQWDFTFTVGRVYRVEWEIETVTAGSLRLIFAGGTQQNGGLRTAAGQYVETLTAVTGNFRLAIQPQASGFSGVVKSVRVY